MTLVNLTERAEIRKETFYKLTNNADVPTAPSEGGRNLLKHNQIGKKGLSTFAYTGQTNSYDCIAPKGSNNWGYGIFYAERFAAIPAGKTLVFSMEVKPDVDCQWNNDVNNTCVGLSSNPYGNDNDDQSKRKNSDRNLKKETWNQIWFSYTAKDETKDYTLYDATSNFGIVTTNLTADVHFQLRKVKAELAETATPYSQAPEDLGWSVATLVPTQQQRYLWKFEYVYYSDGSVEVTQPVNISIAGADGTNGQTSHVHFAFADNATGGGFSLTTPKAYMGWYADFNEAASNDPKKYKWGKWKGDQGVAGQKGDDGKTSYFHLAYASSADGKTGFSFKESGQQYQGYYTDFTQTSSTDPTKYTWMDRRAGVKVGGVNLLHNSKGPFQPKTGKIDNYVTYSNTWISMEKGKEYTLSAKGTTSFTANHTTDKEKNEICLWLVKHDENISVDRIISNATTGTTGTKFTWNDPSGKYYLRVNAYKIDNSDYAETVQIEEGNVKTTYTRNPEDTQADIDSKADSVLTQEQLNALAEQNSIVKAEMEAKASIDTVNQWITAYQNYVNANDEARAESEKNLQEAAARILQLKTDVGALRQQWDFIDTYMSIQNEGLIIGKSDGSAFAKFANDRISLFSGSSEVMYISQGTLHIENGIFTKTIQIGRFRFETHPADADMLVLRYLGG